MWHGLARDDRAISAPFAALFCGQKQKM